MPILVSVIGAGLAGLSCAYELTKRGFQAIVVEKDEKIGGRVRSEILDGQPINLGAVWVTPALDRTYVRYLVDSGLKDELAVPPVAGNKIALSYNSKLVR